MDIAIVFILIFISLLFSIYNGIFILYPLLLGLLCFTIVSIRRGFLLKDLYKMMLKGSKKSLIVIRIFVLIGAITAVWRASGTVSFIVYYGITLMNAKFFIVSAFLLCSLVSFLLGTSFGTVGTIGVVLIIMAKSGNININIAAGAIISGAYFGDRCSPMSSSANLVATLTNTELYKNIKNMLKNSIIPYLLAVAAYILLSTKNPLVFHGNQIGLEILESFNINIIVLAPAILILLLAAFRVDVKLSMAISIVSGLLIGIFVQHQPLIQMLKYIIIGFSMDSNSFFAGIIKGGGLYSMLKVALIVFVSSAYSGIFEGTDLLKEVEYLIEKLSKRLGIFATTILTSVATASFSCNQTLAVMLTHQLESKAYEKRKIDKYRLALDMENTVIIISAIIPWNIASAVPAASLSADAGFIAYAYYLLLIPLVNLLFSLFRKKTF